jgi:hypothetical protein
MHHITYKNLVPFSQKTNCISITKTNTFTEFELAGAFRIHEEISKLHRMLAKIRKGTQQLGDNHRSKENVKVDFNMWTAFT